MPIDTRYHTPFASYFEIFVINKARTGTRIVHKTVLIISDSWDKTDVVMVIKRNHGVISDAGACTWIARVPQAGHKLNMEFPVVRDLHLSITHSLQGLRIICLYQPWDLTRSRVTIIRVVHGDGLIQDTNHADGSVCWMAMDSIGHPCKPFAGAVKVVIVKETGLIGELT